MKSVLPGTITLGLLRFEGCIRQALSSESKGEYFISPLVAKYVLQLDVFTY